MNLRILHVSTSLIFIVSGLGHLTNPEAIMAKLGSNPISQMMLDLPFIKELMIASGPPLLLGGVLLLMGKQVKWVSRFLLAMTLGITLSTHLGVENVGPLMKNVALMGVLYFLSVETSEPTKS